MTKFRNAYRILTRYERWRRRLMAIAEVAGGLVFLALLAAFCWLCCAASGYHWE